MLSLTLPHPLRESLSRYLGQTAFRTTARHSPASQHRRRYGRLMLCAWLGAAAADAANVQLAWNANPESNISGYRVSYGTSAGSRPTTVDAGAVTSTTVSGLTAGRTYYFAVQAVNQDGLVSNASTEISYLVPTAPANRAPAAVASNVTTNEDQAVSVTLSATDADGNALTYNIVNQPTKGTLSGSGANRTYTPNADVNGTDTFTFRANDGTVNSNTATVTITINAVNDAPTASSQSVTTNEDQAVGILLSANDKEGSSLTYSIISPPTKGTLGGNGNNRTYTPNADVSGSDSFTFRVNDGTANSGNATVSITITAVNDAPVAAGQSLSTTNGQPLAIRLSATDKETTTLSYSIVTQPTKGTLSGTRANRTYTPNAGATGNDTFTFRANDGSANSDTATINISLSAVNAAPVVANRTASTAEDKAVSITLSASDADSDALSYSISAPPAHGTLSGSGASRTYTPNANFNGSDSFTYRANDGTVDSSPATVSVTVTPVNDAPVATSQSVSTAANQAVKITLAATDKDSDPLSYRIVSEPTKGKLSGTAPNLTYTPDAGASGADSLTFVARDREVDSNNGVVTITLTAAKPPKVTNRAPVFATAAPKFTARQRQNFSERIEARDPDAGDVVVFRKINGPEWLNVAADGRLTGTPPAGTKSLVRSRVRASDKDGAFTEADIEIKVGPAPLPLPWNLARIGSIRPDANAFSKSGSLTLKAAGALASRQDAGVFAWQTLSDQGEIIARVGALANASKDTKVGVMMRRSLATNSKYAFLGVDGQGRIHWAQRAMPTAAAKGASRAGGKLPDVWLKLRRSPRKIIAYTSRNGRDWTFIGSVWRRDVALSRSCYIGLWATSGSDDLCTAVFRDVSATP